MAGRRVVPLFPLNVVLFPGMELPLHIFEPRYRLMIDHCLVERLPFAISLIRAGEEVGVPAEPYLTGTLAEISDVARLPDGRLHILVTGSARVRVVELLDGEPYAQARVELLPEPPADDVPAAALDRARTLFGAYIEILLSMANVPMMAQLPEDPAKVSYAIATALQTDLFTKQALLESPSARERLEREVTLMEGEVDRLRAFSDVLSSRGYFFYRGRRLGLN